MNLSCPRCIPHFEDLACSPGSQNRPNSGRVVRSSYYFRRSDRQWLRRYFCTQCRRSFSAATSHPERGQHKRHLNAQVLKLLCSGVSQRDVARVLKINPKTVERKFRFLALRARVGFAHEMRKCAQNPSHKKMYFDEMESFEHTRCKPLSIALAVSGTGRKILAVDVARMPAKGRLAEISRKKYGSRLDERGAVLREFMLKLSFYASSDVELISDKNPMYRAAVQSVFGQARHTQYKGRKPVDIGQGELRGRRFDPLFDLNHTCAMARAHMSRLFRKTWCTTKKPERLLQHFWLYAHYHNTVLTAD